MLSWIDLKTDSCCCRSAQFFPGQFFHFLLGGTFAMSLRSVSFSWLDILYLPGILIPFRLRGPDLP